MPLDALTVSALTAELKDKIEGGKIDKVQQPGRDLLLVSLRSKGESLRLLIAAGTGTDLHDYILVIIRILGQ